MHPAAAAAAAPSSPLLPPEGRWKYKLYLFECGASRTLTVLNLLLFLSLLHNPFRSCTHTHTHTHIIGNASYSKVNTYCTYSVMAQDVGQEEMCSDCASTLELVSLVWVSFWFCEGWQKKSYITKNSSVKITLRVNRRERRGGGKGNRT